jgi:hypothetical protein
VQRERLCVLMVASIELMAIASEVRCIGEENGKKLVKERTSERTFEKSKCVDVPRKYPEHIPCMACFQYCTLLGTIFQHNSSHGTGIVHQGHNAKSF